MFKDSPTPSCSTGEVQLSRYEQNHALVVQDYNKTNAEPSETDCDGDEGGATKK